MCRKKLNEGRSLLVATLGEGMIVLFWGLTYFDEGAAMPASLEARQDSRVYLWAAFENRPFLVEHGALAFGVACLMAQRMQHASGIVDGLAFQPVARRLARLLLDQYPAEQVAIERSLTLDEMAARIGSTREMVCRILYRFAAQGAIQIKRTEFSFVDRQVLENY